MKSALRFNGAGPFKYPPFAYPIARSERRTRE